MLEIVLLIIGILLLVKGAEFLVDAAVAIAGRLNVSYLVIGLTVVAFGTSAPELAVNVIAGIRGNTALAVGNILGSNISNILLILGIAAVIHPLSVTRETIWREIPFSLLAVIVLGFIANDRLIDGRLDSLVSRIDGLVLLSFFTVFLYYLFAVTKQVNGVQEKIATRTYGSGRAGFMVILGLACMLLGGKWIVVGAVGIAERLGLSESVVGLSIVAVGTSLPELATSAVAAYKKRTDIAVGNVVGSNIFNIFMVLGISAVVRPLPFETENNLDVGMVIFAGLLLFMFMFSGKKGRIDRWEGAIALLIYAGYMAYRLLAG
jgi:cation:H+ antiporter